MWPTRTGLYREQDSGGSGGASATAAAASGQAGASAPAVAPATPPQTGNGGFDWKAAGANDEQLALVGDRQWKNPGDLLTSYRNLEKLTGVPADQIIKLPKTADPKAWDPVYDKLGRPASADKYVIPLPEGDKGEFATTAKNWFHEAGISQAQATKLAEKWNAFTAEQQKAQTTEIERANQEEVIQLKQAWGSEYEKHSALVDKAAETFGMTQEQLEALKVAMGPKAAMTFLHTLGTKLGVEDTVVPGITGQANQFQQMTPQTARAEIERLKHDKTFAQLFNSADPQTRMEARAKMDRLSKLAAPGVTPVGAATGRTA